MGCGGIAHLVNRLHGCVDCSVKSDCIICTGDIQVNCSRKADCIHSQMRKLLGAGKGTVSADYHKTVNAVFFGR